MKAGLLLLSGGAGNRLGGPKHALEHPDGGTWGGHLLRVFESVFSGAPVLVLGEALPDRPDLPRFDDPREGPAVALRAWAGTEAPVLDRWWIVACDQVRWTPQRLSDWALLCESADPSAAHWVMALHGGHLQPLGGWFPSSLRPDLAHSTETSLVGLATALPHLALPCGGPEWLDVDTAEDLRRFQSESWKPA